MVMGKDMNLVVMMVIQSMVTVVVINARYKMDGVVMEELQHQKVSVLNSYPQEALSFQRELFKEVEKLCKESQ